MILPNVSLFPGMMLPLYIFEPRYRQMLADVLEGDRLFAVAMQEPTAMDEEPASVGGIGMVRASRDNPDGTSNLFLQGLARVIVHGVADREPYPRLRIEPVTPPDEPSLKAEALALKVKELVRHQLGLEEYQKPGELTPEAPDPKRQLADSVARLESPPQIADLVTYALIADPSRKQELLETLVIEDRLDKLIAFLLEQD